MNSFNALRDWAGRSMVPGLFATGILVLLLQIPIGMLVDLLRERRERRDSAVSEVTRTWGSGQVVAGPFMAVPYLRRQIDGSFKTDEQPAYAFFLPERLNIVGDVQVEKRSRGIFAMHLYTARLKVSGIFSRPDLTQWQIPPVDILWSKAMLVLGLTDPKAIRAPVRLAWGQRTLDFACGHGVDSVGAAIHAPIPKPQDIAGGTGEPFSFEIVLGGSEQLRFLPLGAQTTIDLKSPWPDPSFAGAYLPATREISSEGFSASWSIYGLGRKYPAMWRQGEIEYTKVMESALGVDLISAVDGYSMTHRSVKYQLIIILLTFVVFWTFELLYGIRIHIVSYLMVGSTLCLFYFLLLSLSEHVGFTAAYVTASAGVVGAVGGYGWALLRAGWRAAAVSGMLATVYGFMFVLLRIEDYALAAGSIGLFAILCLAMFSTRRVDWYRLSARFAVAESTKV